MQEAREDFVLRPVAKACRDFYERKFFKLVAKITGVKLATAMLTCSQALPVKTPPLVRQIAKMLCG